jgi:type VI secretion system secreted protein Hcp
MSFSICLKINKVQGESTVANHLGEIDVLSWKWGLTQSATGQVGGARAGTADVTDLTIMKYVDNASPTLIQACFNGDDQVQAVLTVMKGTAANPLEFLKITMSKTVIISSVRPGDPLPNDKYSETVTFNFAHVKFEYTPLKPDNSKGATATAEFDISRQA